jgi:hypothetical protein
MSAWIDEETFFARSRKDPKLIKLKKKWSEGSSPIMLIQAGYEKDEPEYKKCYWYLYPSSNRCHDCQHINECDKACK